MAGPKPIYAEALLDKNGKVLFLGPLAGAIKDILELVASLKAHAASLLAGLQRFNTSRQGIGAEVEVVLHR